MTIGASGSLDAPFQLQALPGGVTVDGADDFSDPFRWTLVAGNVWLATGVTWNPKQVFADGARLSASTAAPAALPARSFRWVSGTGLYVNAGGGNPGPHQTRVGRRTYGFTASGRTAVSIDGFTVTRTEDSGVYLAGACENIAVTNCTIGFANRNGIQVVGGFALLLASNTVSDNRDHGIALSGGASGGTLDGNESFRNVNPATATANGIYVSGSPGMTLRRNRLHDNQDSGLHLQSNSNNCVSYLNLSWNNGDSGYDHIGVTGATHTCDVAYGNARNGFAIQSNSTGTKVFDSIAANNGVSTGAFDLWVDNGSTSGFSSNDNLFWNANGQQPVKYVNTTYSSVTTYRAASGQDTRTVQADPGFVNPAAGDFHLMAGSPAIDNGNAGAAHWPVTDLEGRPRLDDWATANAGLGSPAYSDRGALEYVPPDRAPVVAVPAVVPAAEGSALTLVIHAADPDGQPIPSLTADLTGLPAGSNAVFTPGPGDTTGTLTWTPTYADAGSYPVSFTAANALSGSAGSVIQVTNVDRAPAVAAPATATVTETSALTITVHAADADGQPIAALAADLSALPPGNDAVFTAAPGDTAGTLTWTPTYADAGSYAVRFTAANALSGSAVTAITVADRDRAPVVAVPAVAPASEGSPWALTVHAADPDGQPITSLTANVAGLPAGHPAVFTAGPGDTTGTLTWTPTYDDAGSYTVSFTAANALSGSAATAITVTDTDQPPTVIAPAAVTTPEGSPLVLAVHAADLDGQPVGALTADLSGLPAGAKFVAAPGDTTGTLTWLPGYGDAGSYTVTFTATNALSGSASTAITVTNTDRAPLVSAPAAATVAEAGALTITVHAADPDGDPITALTADVSTLPAGAKFVAEAGDSAGTLSWTPGYGDAGRYTVTFTAANALPGTAASAITVTNTDRAPLVSAPATATVAEGNQLAIAVHASDPDGDPITLLSADLSGLPAGAKFDADPGDTSGTLTWITGFSDAGTYTATFTVANALTDSVRSAITVINVDQPPVLAAPDSVSAPEASPLAIRVHAADPDGQPIGVLTADLSGLPAGAAFTADPGDTTGTLTWTPGFADAGSYSVTFRAANALGDSARTLVRVTNSDRAPMVTAPASASGPEGGALTVTVQAADPDSEAITSLTADLSGLPAGSNAAFTPGTGNTSGTLSWTPTYHDAGSYTVTFTAANALSGSTVAAIGVTDVDQAPAVAAPATVPAAEASPLTVTVQAADPDGTPITSLGADLSGLPAGNNAVFTPGPGNTAGTLTWTPTYNDAGSYTVGFTAANALSGSAATLITVSDADRAPVVTAPATVSGFEASPLTVTVQAADPDGAPITSLGANLTGLPAGNNAVFTPGPGNHSGTLTWTPTYADSGRYTVTFTAANALSGVASTVISVADVFHPYASGTYYVDGSNHACSDQGPGTEAQPYCTISAALAAHSGPSTAILVKPGVYRERVTISASGTSDGPLILHATAPGVVIDGADDFSNPALWAPYAGNVWLAASADWGPKQIFADGARLAGASGSPASIPPGSFLWVSNVGLYVNVGGGNPASHQVMVGRRKYGFVAYGEEWVTIEGFTVTRTEDRGIFLAEDCANVSVLDNTVTFTNRYGIQASTGYAFVIGGNTVSDNNDHGISVTTGVTGSIVEDNESFRNARPSERAANGIYVHDSIGNVIRRNRLHDNQDTGLHFQAGANNNICYLNRSWNNGDHGYDHLGASGNIHICDVAYGNYKDGFSVEGNSPGTQIYDSIAIENGLTTNEFDLWVDLGSSTGFVSNDNVFWNSSIQPPVKFIATLYSSVAAYSAVSGQDTRTLQADPRFVNPAAGDFHLNAGSPAIDDANSGVPYWPSTDVEGRARIDDPMRPNLGAGPVAFADRGAMEYRPAVLAVTPASGTAPLIVTANAAGSVGPDGTAASFRFDFGDGTVTGPQPGPVAIHAYSPGNWITTVTVAGQNGGTSAAALPIAVNAPPVAALTAAPASGNAPLAVTLNASASTDPDGTVVSYRFDFGDGTSAGPQPAATALHTYAGGTWIASVTVTDDRGGTGTANFAVTALSGATHAPVVAVAPAVSIAEASPLTLTVHAADSDGQRIETLTANLSGLPAGHHATFVPGPGDSTGVLSWTPTYADSGRYTVTFTAANDMEGSASTVITVSNVDRAPVVTAPVTAGGTVANLVTVNVNAMDPDGDAIASLTADLSGLPAGNGATFVPGTGDTAGTFRWTPAAGDSGSYLVRFTAANALSGSDTTVITVKPFNLLPVVVLAAAPRTGNEPLTVVADASGSNDPDGRIVSYRFDFGDGTVVGPQAGGTASHAYAAGRRTLTVFVTDDDGGVSSAATQITIATAPGGPNLVGNPSFEVSNAGWAPFNGSTLQRIAGGFDGSWSMSMTGPASTATFGATDAPNWVGTTTAAGIRYRFSAWVRSSAGTGQVRLRVREYLNGVRIGATGYFSNMVDLTPDWTELTLDYVSQTAGSTLDLQVEDVPLKVSEEFDVDNLAIWVVPATPPALASRAPEEGPGAPLASATAEEPVLDLDSAAPFWKVRVVGADAQGVPRFTRLALRVEGREVAASEVTGGPAGSSMEVLFDRHDLKTLFAGLAGSPRVTATLIGDQISGTVTLGTLALEVVGAAQPLRPVLTSNPMRASGTIGFATSREGPLQADLFDASGRRVRRLMSRAGAARGWHDVSVDGRDEGGVALGAGIYFYRIVSVDGVATGRLVLLK